MDYTRLRAAALRDGEAEEAVTVDTRALIDKVLARYSGEWTTLRELIQNAADAQATTVKIKWETLPSTTVPLPTVPQPTATDAADGGDRASSDLLRHTILHHTLRRLLVENDGQAFAATDWARLKRIAEGNPDETKIGAFGVGFYSVFADCEEPFVSSGSEAMAFYWKGNALFTRKLVVPADQRSPTGATTFVLDYRNATTALPNLLSVSQFLASSLTFVALQRIEFWIDDWKLLDLHKTLSPSTVVPIPRDLSTRTKDGLMTVAAVEWSSAQIDAVYMNAVGWKPPASAVNSASGSSGGSSSAAASGKTTDSYGLSAADMPSLRSFFSRLTSSATASATALASQRSKAAREEKAAQDALQQNLTGLDRASIFLRVTSAKVQTKVAASFAAELERATKKPPPKMTSMAILTSSYEDVLTSGAKTVATTTGADVFASVLPSKKPGGRIFIGFPTMQTTGGGLHVSAPSLIPTVEREAIDLNARWVRNWNMELLRASGILTRLAFVNEMAVLDSKFRQHLESTNRGSKGSRLPTPTAEDVARFVPEALHILKTYTFGDSTPSAYVGQIIEEAFWTAYRVPAIDVFSTRGVLSTAKVRMGDERISRFVDGIPVVVAEMKDSPFVHKLHEFGILHDITIDDVRSELESKPLDREKLTHFVKWLAACAASGDLDPPSVRSLLRAGIASIAETEDGGGGDDNPIQSYIVELDTIRNFLSGNKIPASLPLPPTTIPYSITSTIPHSQLQALGWTPLDLVPWLEYLMGARARLGEKRDMTKSATFAAQVLMVLSKNWDNVSAAQRPVVLAMLEAQTTMPTKMGMRRPPDAFFPSVKLFDDLPTLAPSCHGLKEKFLVALGVRKTIDLDTIFTRLLSQPTADSKSGGGSKGPEVDSKKWSHVELAKYLASVRTDIPARDFARLRDSAICPAEAGPAGKEWTVPSTKLYRAAELFEPCSEIRELGFAIMQWPGVPGSYRRNSPEGGLLSSLGLRICPSVPELVAKMASPDRNLRDKARAYYIANHQTNGYQAFNISLTDKAILPVASDGSSGSSSNEKQLEQLARPMGCYTNPDAAILGFPILRADLLPHAAKFGVPRDPPINSCVKRLLTKPPQSHKEAVVVFGYFSSRLADIRGDALRQLQQARFVPVTKRSGWTDKGQRMSMATAAATAKMEHVKPEACYLGVSSTYGDIFDFVDFGRSANAFLFQCGSKMEPTKVELARQACKEPARLLSTLQTPERYLNLLRSLAEDLPRLKEDRELFGLMQTAPFLLASREAVPTTGATETEEETPVRQFQLAAAGQIAVLDDYISYRLFKDKLMCAPEEDVLETFYLALGAQVLSSIVQEEIQIGRHSSDQTQAALLRKYVLERSKIFLHEYQKYRRDVIRHDHRWLEKHLRVEIVQSVALRRSLRGGGGTETHTEKRSAASARQTGGHVLYISAQGPVDMYQVGQAVCQVVLNRPSQQAYFFFEPFLKLDLLDLRARGYNVDRILREKAAEARMAEEERQDDEMDRQPDAGSMDGNKGKGRVTTTEGDGNGQEASPEAVQQDMRNAIRSGRPYGSSTLFQPPSEPTVRQQATYCDSNHAHDLEHIGQAPGGTPIYLSRGTTSSVTGFLAERQPAIAAFERLLRDVAVVYGLASTVLHIYHDVVGPTIAFNSGGSIFCNLRFFEQLHAAGILSTAATAVQARVDATVWWWVVLAHELAHNLEPIHNARHSFYTESFVQQYFHGMTMHTAALSAGLAVQPAALPQPLVQQPDVALPPPPSYHQAMQTRGQGRSLLD
ncbi:ATPase subunit c domain protein [Grosmannia clavigera kw1407]|uniref:ATPase subunit c domain protein n=1 Tax=Grosmannia clavigera (strain kw1407 / UAMH 11150) TaxID=655863 RepID=F0XD09_GROCL|nr:ATPase subunit c domain protein [Grosmannia clavigera kw1407]EFX03597.1 ATPase subunit c domain protein [Grosmannia clavigera kw1407]